MEEERIVRALARIEAAAKRIEAAAVSTITSKADPDLRERHENLRREARAALSELDSLIGNLEP